jgi:hypothetical protein
VSGLVLEHAVLPEKGEGKGKGGRGGAGGNRNRNLEFPKAKGCLRIKKGKKEKRRTYLPAVFLNAPGVFEGLLVHVCAEQRAAAKNAIKNNRSSKGGNDRGGASPLKKKGTFLIWNFLRTVCGVF